MSNGYLEPINYSQRGDNGSQYSDRLFKPLSVVDAKYIKSYIYPGNPFVEALPPAPSEDELLRSSAKSFDFDHDEIVKLPFPEQTEIIGQLKKLIRIPLPSYYPISTSIRGCLLSAHSCRRFNEQDPHLNEVKDPLDDFPRTNSYDDMGTDGGCNIIGASGCGKTTSLDPVLAYYPQVIRHKLKNGGSFLQVVYLRIDCPRDNTTNIYERIGKALDKVLQTVHLKTFEKMLKGTSRTTNAERATILERLVEAYGIGLIILDESQNIKFSSAYDAYMNDLLNISNMTNVCFILVGTHYINFSYKLTEERRKVARRVGGDVFADRYCRSESYFRLIMANLSRYQLFEPEIDVLNNEDILNAIWDYSQGSIEPIMKLWIEMNIAYIEGERQPVVDGNFVRKVINNRLYHQNQIVENENRLQRKTITAKLRDAISDGFNWESGVDDGTIITDADRAAALYMEAMRIAANDMVDTMGGKGNYSKDDIRSAVIRSALNLARKGTDPSATDIKDSAVKLLKTNKLR